MSCSVPPIPPVERRIRLSTHLAGFIVILAAAFLFRVAFLQTPQVPVVWDAAGYHIQAKTFLSAFKGLSDREFFNREWRRAYDMASFKGEVYPLFLAAVYAFSGESAETARLVQAVLDSIMCGLIYLLAWNLFRSWKLALVAGLFCACYLPLIFSAGRLLTETLGVFLIIFMLWLLYRGISRGGYVEFFISGLVAALAMVCRTAFQYILPFVLAGIVLSLWKERKIKIFVRGGIFLFGVAILIVPRLCYTGKIYGSPLLSGSWRNGEAVYGGIHPETQGFQTQVIRPSEELQEALKRSGRLRIEQGDYYRAYLMILARYPIRSAAIVASKAFSFWRRPYNDFHQTFLIPWGYFVLLHRAVLILALYGLLLSLTDWPRNGLFLVVMAYLCAIALFADLEIRYAFPAMPFLLILSTVSIQFLYRSGGRVLRDGEAISVLIRLFVAGIFFLLYYFFPLPRIQELFPSSGLGFCRFFAAALFALFWMATIPFVRFLARKQRPVSLSWIVATVPPAIFLFTGFSYSWINPYWHEWIARLSGPGQIIRQEIEIPPDIESYRKADLIIDMQSGGGQGFDLDVIVDGRLARRFSRGLTMDWDNFIRTRKAFSVYLQHHRRRLGDLKQWFTIPLPIEELEGKRRISVDIAISRSEGEKLDFIDLFGDYLPSGQPLFYQGPSWSRDLTELSDYKYAVEDDWRIWTREEIQTPVRSSYYDGETWSGFDLSSSPGSQQGRYRVFLQLSRRVRTDKTTPVEITPGDLLIKQSSIPAHRVQVWMIYPEKKRSERFKIEMAHAAPGKEGAISYVVYSDTDGDGLPDRLLGRSELFTVEKAGQWSSWEFTSSEKLVFVGAVWEEAKRVYYGRGEWPQDVLGPIMYYSNNPNANPRMTISPVISNLRISFLQDIDNDES